MPKKKEENEQNTAEETDVTTQQVDAAQNDDSKSAKAEETDDAPTILDTITETVSAAVETVANTATGIAETVAETIGLGADETTASGRGNRAEKVGVVWSDKMQKTVVVRVDRLVKHPMYRKYVRRKKKFMAHDELGATVGDKVRIVETRPLSAHKRWRVVEIIQKAEK